jgi:hypothetical protein
MAQLVISMGIIMSHLIGVGNMCMWHDHMCQHCKLVMM